MPKRRDSLLPLGRTAQNLLLGFVALVMLPDERALSQSSRTLPPQVEAAIVERRERCYPEAASLKPGFITQKDVNGDGVDDYILDYDKFVCGTHQSYFCGTAGCLTQIFASLPGGAFVKVLDENVREVRFTRIKGRPAMQVGLHGGKCGRTDAEPCGVTLYWNGREFNPAD
jgi:hypothetical protein